MQHVVAVADEFAGDAGDGALGCAGPELLGLVVRVEFGFEPAEVGVDEDVAGVGEGGRGEEGVGPGGLERAS